MVGVGVQGRGVNEVYRGKTEGGLVDPNKEY